MIDPLLTWILASGVEEKGGLGGRGESPPFMADLRVPISNQKKHIGIKHVRCKTIDLKVKILLDYSEPIGYQNLSAVKVMRITILGISYWLTQKDRCFLIGCLRAGWKRRGLRPDWWSRRKLCSCCCTKAACSAATSYTFNISHKA
jgi:hypothetical protein